MRKQLSLASSVLALSLATSESAVQGNWRFFSEPFIAKAYAREAASQKVDETLGRKPAVSGDVRRYTARSDRPPSRAISC